MANATSSQLQQLYIAYFARPGDPMGLDYWVEAGTTTEQFAASMWAQPEFQDVNGGLSVKNQVNQLYQNLFRRDADQGGLLYWAGKIDSGEMELASIANDLIYAATYGEAEGSEDDLACLSNRTAAAEAYIANKISPHLKPPLDDLPGHYYNPLPPGYEYFEINKAKDFMRDIYCDTPHDLSIYPLSINNLNSFLLKKDSLTGLTSQGNLLVNEQENEELINTEFNQTSNDECGCNKELETLGIADNLYSSLDNSYVEKSLSNQSPYRLSPSNIIFI